MKAAPTARGSRGSATAWLWNGLFLHLLITEEVKPDPGKQARSAEINSLQQDKGTDLCAARATAFPQAQQQLPRSSSETCTSPVAAPAPPAASLCGSQGTAVNQICLRYQSDLLQVPAAQAGAVIAPTCMVRACLTCSMAIAHSPFSSAACAVLPALHGQRAHAHCIIKGTAFLGPTIHSPPPLPDTRAQQSRCSPVFPTFHFYTCTCSANLL